MSVLSAFYNKEGAVPSPVVDDVTRVVDYDEDGNEIVSFPKVDYPAIQKSNGVADDWSLNALLKAGIDPAFAIHTSNNTRLDGFSQLQEGIAVGESILDEMSNSDKSE